MHYYYNADMRRLAKTNDTTTAGRQRVRTRGGARAGGGGADAGTWLAVAAEPGDHQGEEALDGMSSGLCSGRMGTCTFTVQTAVGDGQVQVTRGCPGVSSSSWMGVGRGEAGRGMSGV